MFKKTKVPFDHMSKLSQFPHCDPRILHGPFECAYCDKHPDWQALRIAWGIAFTGWEPEDKELPCPCDYARGDTHTQWYGNVARPPEQSE